MANFPTELTMVPTLFSVLYYLWGLPWWFSGKECVCQCRRRRVWSPGWEEPLEKEMATHSSILAWLIPWTQEPGGLQATGSKRVGHDWATKQDRLSYAGVCYNDKTEAEITFSEDHLCLPGINASLLSFILPPPGVGMMPHWHYHPCF